MLFPSNEAFAIPFQRKSCCSLPKHMLFPSDEALVVPFQRSNWCSLPKKQLLFPFKRTLVVLLFPSKEVLLFPSTNCFFVYVGHFVGYGFQSKPLKRISIWIMMIFLPFGWIYLFFNLTCLIHIYIYLLYAWFFRYIINCSCFITTILVFLILHTQMVYPFKNIIKELRNIFFGIFFTS